MHYYTNQLLWLPNTLKKNINTFKITVTYMDDIRKDEIDVIIGKMAIIVWVIKDLSLTNRIDYCFSCLLLELGDNRGKIPIFLMSAQTLAFVL